MHLYNIINTTAAGNDNGTATPKQIYVYNMLCSFMNLNVRFESVENIYVVAFFV